MKKYYSFAMLFFVFFIACKTEKKQNNDLPFDKIAAGNIFSNKIIRNIYKLQYKRKTNEIIKKLKNEFPNNKKYKKYCILALASVQDPASIDILSDFFNENEDEEIKKIAAYSLGQIEGAFTEIKLLNAYAIEKSATVKEEILNSIGKCGTKKGLSFLENIKTEEKNILKGKIKGLSKFAERNIVSENITDEIFEILINTTTDKDTKYWCSYYLYRSEINLNKYAKEIISAYNNTKNIYTKNNIIKMCSRSRDTKIIVFLKNILKSENQDYRLKVSSIKSSMVFDYYETEKIMTELLSSKNIHVAVTAGDFFIKKGNTNLTDEYYEIAKKLHAWQTRAKMFNAALKFAVNKNDISEAIISGYEASENIYEKASFLGALSFDVGKYDYVNNVTFSSENPVIRTAGINSLSLMRYSKKFDNYKKKIQKEKGINLDAEFAEIFKKAVLSGDIALMTIAADIIKNPDFKYNLIYKNTFFITQAIDKCILPRDYEAYVSLLQADEFINGKKPDSEIPKFKYKSPDWNLIKSIPVEQKIKFFTTNGNFVIKLKVNNSPFAVSTFIKLAINGFFKNKSFHRIVPNFVIQSGCQRGDGWGNLSYAIRSEFPPIKYEEGIVGLASAGKDTESSQWFVTNTITPHLEGKYSVVGIITEGLETIHKMQIGDKIIDIKLL